MFSLIHFVAMAGCGFAVWLLTKYILSGGATRTESWLKLIAIVAPLMDPIYWIWEYQTFGKLHPHSTLPLYLCSLFWMMIPLAVFLKPGFLKQMALANVATVGLATGILGFVFNTHLNYYPFFSFVPVRSLIYHFLMILGAVLLWVSGYYKPKAGDQWRSYLPVLVLLVPCLILNRLYGYDYCYTNGGHDTPIEILSSALPKALFLLVLYGGLFLVLWFIFYRKLPLFKRSK